MMLMYDDEPDGIASELSSISGSYRDNIKNNLKETHDFPIMLDNFTDTPLVKQAHLRNYESE